MIKPIRPTVTIGILTLGGIVLGALYFGVNVDNSTAAQVLTHIAATATGSLGTILIAVVNLDQDDKHGKE